jgi:hypothetical protein
MDEIKIKATSIEDFSREIHSPEIHANVTNFRDLEVLTEKWIKNYVKQLKK